MTRKLFALGLLLMSATACVTQPETSPSYRLTPAQAVINAAESERGVTGVFEMVVRASGRERGRLYLNSELDYRDPRCLTIVLSGEVEAALEERLGAPVEQALQGRAIAVRGTARTERIDFFSGGQPSGSYYYQTHLRLRSPSDLTVSGETAF